jgi:hypothetical protein
VAYHLWSTCGRDDTGTLKNAEYAHAMAPGASILLAGAPVTETVGAHGFLPVSGAENYVIDQT